MLHGRGATPMWIDQGGLALRPVMKAIVVDMNCVRREERILPVLEGAVRDQIPVLLPEALLYEGVKGRDWEEGLRVTLGPIARFRCGVVGLARPLQYLVEFERKTGMMAADLAYREQQPRLLGILEDVRTGSRATFDQIRRENPEAPDHVTGDDDEDSRKLLLGEIGRVDRRLPPELRKLLRRFPGDDLPATLLAEPDRSSEFQTWLVRHGYDEQVIQTLALLPSVTANEYFCRWALVLWWIAFGGAADAKAKTFSNDLRDIEYLILGLGCTGFVTDDTRLKTLYRQLSITIRLRWARSTAELARRFPGVPPIGVYCTKEYPVD